MSNVVAHTCYPSTVELGWWRQVDPQGLLASPIRPCLKNRLTAFLRLNTQGDYPLASKYLHIHMHLYPHKYTHTHECMFKRDKVHHGAKGIAAGAWDGRSHFHPVRDRQRHTGAQLTFSFLFSLRPQPIGYCHPYSGWVFPVQLNLSGNILIDTPREVFPW